MNAEDQSKASGLLTYLLDQPESPSFTQAFDFRGQNLQDYPLIIKTPMDLFQVKQKLLKNFYFSLHDFLCDLILIWDNTRIYHMPNSNIVNKAESMESAMIRYCSLHSISLESASKMSKVCEHPDWIPIKDKLALSDKLKSLDSKKLGFLIDVIETECPAAVRKVGEHIQVRIDALDKTTFNRVQEMSENP